MATPFKLGNTPGKRLSLEVRPVAQARPEHRFDAERGQISQTLSRRPRVWLTETKEISRKRNAAVNDGGLPGAPELRLQPDEPIWVNRDFLDHLSGHPELQVLE